ncbi:hypothetical protein SeMB42_g02476 [Synchytrium endobioticum]|uniref:Uncharacterized protein n=1 Tax=Synchytrium endobioticum TaxID=286115 RepID=A0A507DDY3_9FUNG|nr:hypothetical protein SeMB42_g02476 [Synchytrium endobioticum]
MMRSRKCSSSSSPKEGSNWNHRIDYVLHRLDLDPEKNAWHKPSPYGTCLNAIGIRGKCLRIIESLYNSASLRAKVGDHLSKEVKIEKGVRQGDPLSTALFDIFINDFESYWQNRPSNFKSNRRRRQNGLALGE